VIAALAGAGVGAGATTAVVLMRRRPLAAEMVRRMVATNAAPGAAFETWDRRVAAVVIRGAGRRHWPGQGLRADLKLTDQQLIDVVCRQVKASLGAACSLAILAANLVAIAPVTGAVLGGWLVLSSAVVGAWLPLRRVRAAAKARRALLAAIVIPLADMIASSLAGGVGVAEAVHVAIRAGQGWAFGQLRAALADAKQAGLSPAAALMRLGEESQVPALSELASVLVFVETSGAQAEAALRAKAAGLRDRILADSVARVKERGESMRGVQALLGLAWTVFVAAPAFVLAVHV
jgi:Flp pilus assembly protein TadB